MSSDAKQNWPDESPEAHVTHEQELAEERLAFTDRIIGLEQQVRELQEASLATPTERVAIESHLAAIQSSSTWRVGRLAMLPVRALRVVKRRVLG